MARAVGCISGGLDSTLAVCLMRDLGVDVIGLHAAHLWHAAPHDPAARPPAVREVESRGVPVRIVDAAEADLAMLRDPTHGFGKHLNPCIDCRIWTLRQAKALMEAEAADFVFTGEVVGQRPMSQRRQVMDLIEKRSGLQDLLLRPLCAKNLPPTKPERKGLVNRERLLDLSGRSRKPQMALAKRFGIAEYATPAGGCLLTDPGFAHRLADLMEHEGATPARVELLKVGRHFRMPGGARLVVGRNHEENLRLEALAEPTDTRLGAADMPGPLALLRGEAEEEALDLAASMTLRYGKAKPGEPHRVHIERGDEVKIREATCADDPACRARLITLETPA